MSPTSSSPGSSVSKYPALDRLRALPRFGDGPGLHRMAALRDALLETGGEPAPPAIQITGSNGKGTVAHLTAAILRELGISAGLYTSPHFVRFEERFQIDGRQVPLEELEEAAARVEEAIERFRSDHPRDEVASFEALTALAFEIFRRRGPQVLVTEAGIGGRFDSTRVFEPSGVAALTSLEMEHGSILGPTLLDIAYDKSGLCPDGGVLVLGEIEAEIQRRLAGALALRGARLLPVRDRLVWKVHEIAPDRMRCDLDSWDGKLLLSDLEMGVIGERQATNAALAVQLVRSWLARTERDFSATKLEAAIHRALATAHVPGRLDRLDPDRLWPAVGETEKGPEVCVDVAHTPAALEALAETVNKAFRGRPRVLVLGISRGRRTAMLEPLLRGGGAAVLTRSTYRGEQPERLLSSILKVRRQRVFEIAPTIADALREAGKLAKSLGPDAVVLVAGSYFLAAEAAALAMGEDPTRLGFPD